MEKYVLHSGLSFYLQGPCKGNYQINLKSTSGPINVLLVNKDSEEQSPVVVQVPPANEELANQAKLAAQAAENQNPNFSGKLKSRVRF